MGGGFGGGVLGGGHVDELGRLLHEQRLGVRGNVGRRLVVEGLGGGNEEQHVANFGTCHHAVSGKAEITLGWQRILEWVPPHSGQPGHAIRLMEEVGRLLGAWLKTSRAGAGAGCARAEQP